MQPVLVVDVKSALLDILVTEENEEADVCNVVVSTDAVSLPLALAIVNSPE